MASLLDIQNLTVTLNTRDGISPVIDNLSLSLEASDSLSIVGESGCGKSMTALALMGLLPQPVANIESGSILFKGEDLTSASESRLREIRGNEMSMIFQEPMTSLNPVYSIGDQIAEVLRLHQRMSKRQSLKRAVELLDAVRVPQPQKRIRDYPHQLSGGQRQRVMIAIALACEPEILIADEPTTALDVTVQAEIFELLAELQQSTGTAIILITHDMGVVAEVSKRMMVMYAGRKVEEGTVDQVIDHPKHPYTQGLINCVPHIQDLSAGDPDNALPDSALHAPTDKRSRLLEIPGIVPSLFEFGQNTCLFASRCSKASEQCRQQRPEEVLMPGSHAVACWHVDDSPESA